MGGVPRVLLLGHSFIRRLKYDLDRVFDSRATHNFGLTGTADVFFHGVGGRTVHKLHQYDLEFVRQLRPDIIILEIGTNDLTISRPEVVGSFIEDLCVELCEFEFVSAIGVCHVIPRGCVVPRHEIFNKDALLLQQYLEVVLEQLDKVFCWQHRVFSSPDKDLYVWDGVHLNKQGQYQLYRSYRGAILKALRYLHL